MPTYTRADRKFVFYVVSLCWFFEDWQVGGEAITTEISNNWRKIYIFSSLAALLKRTLINIQPPWV